MRKIDLGDSNTLTMDKLFLTAAQYNLYGMKIKTFPYLPKEQIVKIRDDFEWITDEGRERINNWLLETFGERDVAYIFDMNACGLSEGKIILMRPEMAVKLKLDYVE